MNFQLLSLCPPGAAITMQITTPSMLTSLNEFITFKYMLTDTSGRTVVSLSLASLSLSLFVLFYLLFKMLSSHIAQAGLSQGS